MGLIFYKLVFFLELVILNLKREIENTAVLGLHTFHRVVC